MSITQINRDYGVAVNIVRMVSTDTLSSCAASGYLTAQASNITSANQGIWTWLSNDMVLLSASDGVKLFTLNTTFTTLVLYSTAGNGAVTLPVTGNDFVVFDSTLGALKDLGFSASDASKTKVIMANGAVTSGNVPTYVDTAGTIGNGPVATNKLLTSAITTPDVSINLVRFDITVGQAALASAGTVTLQASSGSKQYKIVNLWANSNGTNFSGGGGNRLLSITDGTTVYSVIPAASLQTLVNAGWGITALPYPASAALNTSTVAGQGLIAQYSGGSADYTAGSVVISGILQRVA